jgi:phosphoglucomutase
MKVSPFAGKPAEPSMLVNIPKLITAYYTETPDPFLPSQRVSLEHRGTVVPHLKSI